MAKNKEKIKMILKTKRIIAAFLAAALMQTTAAFA